MPIKNAPLATLRLNPLHNSNNKKILHGLARRSLPPFQPEPRMSPTVQFRRIDNVRVMSIYP